VKERRTSTRVVPINVNSRSLMSEAAKRHRLSDAERDRVVRAARERFLAGDDRVRGVRPEVATSWYRCREQYHVDPRLDRAPPASAHDEPSAERHWVRMLELFDRVLQP